MIQVVKANKTHVEAIAKVCSKGWQSTINFPHTQEYIEQVIQEFYNHERIKKEVSTSNREWGGYYVALEDGEVVGAAGGGMTEEDVGELYVIYLDSNRRNEGIGTKLLEAVTMQQKELFGAKKQWVSVIKGNKLGIPFYEAKGFTFQHEVVENGMSPYIKCRYSREI
ncbi:GNAT family N-acetyltransferase [Bacillus sp. B1-b2]|uniref:GNAT family N-acetyltransferase n=1 Tax=Bacillus sp. B1-b2 TaxID=2653201 RepID=UPI0012616D52|nr:GNAT family N-acetyltransferase [Bacillus sp. B1-b2]KAB7667150.1 GNAT family N-acetyltransferase [Bacillus sp. B1-b2]